MKTLASVLIMWKWFSLAYEMKGTTESRNFEEPVANFIQKQGYPLEIYQNVQTVDGYLLDVYRIPHGKTNVQSGIRNPVLLMHGLFGSSGDFLALGPKNGLGFLLAENYDVWLANARGTTQSRKHVKLRPNVDKEYWEFSWNEIGLYDLPAIFDLIQDVTKFKKLSYIGLSQGTTAFYVLASEKPSFNDRVSIMISLAPIAFTKNFNNPIIGTLAAFEPMWTKVALITGLHELPPEILMSILRTLGSTFCRIEAVYNLCSSVLSFPLGAGSAHLNGAVLPVVIAISFSGISTRQILHFAQNINSGEFCKYDFGSKENIKQYRSAIPPKYNVKAITAPVAVYYAENDWLGNYKDVERFCKEIPNCVHKYKVPDKTFNHLDFAFAASAVQLVYNNVLYIVDEYSKDMG